MAVQKILKKLWRAVSKITKQFYLNQHRGFVQNGFRFFIMSSTILNESLPSPSAKKK